MSRALSALSLACLLGVAPIAAAPAGADPGGAFFKRFAGEWAGDGTMVHNADGKARTIRCEVNGSPHPSEVSINGVCRMAVVFKRAIGAEIRSDGDRYTGTYVGSKAGEATLDGRLVDGTLVLTMTYPREVNGDTMAEMQVTNHDDGTFRLTVRDKMPDSEEPVIVSDVVFMRPERAAAAVNNSPTAAQ